MNKIPQDDLVRIRKHAIDNCCNYNEGNCLIHHCSCLVANAHLTLICKHFKNAVLPINRVLRGSFEYHNSVAKYHKVCSVCEVKFDSTSRTKQMCPNCSEKAPAKRAKSYRKKKGTCVTFLDA